MILFLQPPLTIIIIVIALKLVVWISKNVDVLENRWWSFRFTCGWSNFKTHSVPFFLYLCEFACNVYGFHNFIVYPTFCGLIFVVILVMLVLEHCHCQLLLQYVRHSILIGPKVGPCVQRNCKKAQYFGEIKTVAFFTRAWILSNSQDTIDCNKYSRDYMTSMPNFY